MDPVFPVGVLLIGIVIWMMVSPGTRRGDGGNGGSGDGDGDGGWGGDGNGGNGGNGGD